MPTNEASRLSSRPFFCKPRLLLRRSDNSKEPGLSPAVGVTENGRHADEGGIPAEKTTLFLQTETPPSSE